MKNKLFIVLLLNVFLVANTPVDTDFTNARLTSGNGEGSNLQTEISIVIDINTTNVVQFNKVGSTLTSLNKTTHPLLIKKFSYNGKNPIRVKISSSKLFLVFNLSDTNETSPTGSLTIGDNIIRDGTTGGATNLGLSAITGISDRAIPILLSAHTVDSDTNGHIDNLKLNFTEEMLTSTTTNSGFSVSGYTVLGIRASAGVGGDSNDSPNSKDVYLRLKEKTSFDTDAKPSVSYSETLSNKLQDSIENNITTIPSFLAKDKAIPIFISASAKSVNNGADIINLGFSEPIFKPLDLSGNTGDITSGGSPSLDGGLVKYSNGDRNISIELNESKPEGYIENGATSIIIRMQITAKDKNGNNFVQVNKTTPVVIETIKPKLLSISKLGDKGYFIASFDEPMKSFNKDNVHIEYNGTLIDGATAPFVYGVKQSLDKKTATIQVVFLPQFTKEEKRTLTFVMKSGVTDLAGNSIDINESNDSHSLSIDKTSPNATDFIIDMNKKVIIIDFNESIAIGTFNPEAIVISRYNQPNIKLTNKSKAIYINDFTDATNNKGKIVIALNDDINSLKSYLKDKRDFNITINANSGIIDLAGNACVSKNIHLSLTTINPFIADSVSPNLLSWEFNLDDKQIILNFDEPMKLDNYNASDLNISDSNKTFDKKLALQDDNSSAKVTTNEKNIEITLFGSQVVKILNSNLAKDKNHTFLEITGSSSIKDFNGNSAKALVNNQAMKAKEYKADKNKISKLNLIPNTWNHVSIDRPTKLTDIMASGKIHHVYTYSNEIWYPAPTDINPRTGYWIKAGDHNSTNALEIPSNSKTYLRGKKSDDLNRITTKIDGYFHLIGIENNISYEEMHKYKNSNCKNMRIHHYDSASISSLAGWDKNSTVLANSSLWVQCVK